MNMLKNVGKYYFSPSEYHGRLLEEIKPSLGFRSNHGPEKWQNTLKNKLKELLGNQPEKKCPLREKTLWTRKNHLGRIEKIIYAGEPFCHVPAYLCVPENL